MTSPVDHPAAGPRPGVDVGDIIAGKYQVERVLGVGGMGVVVAARHKTLGERYAIKFLLPQAKERADVVKRFRQEAMAAARLKSEHVTRVHDDGELPDGSPYLVMEYLDGKDLGAVLRDEGPLAVERAVTFVMQACEALAEAHAAGIIHRDLKPSNLFVIKRVDGTPSVKLIDFGISKVQLPAADGESGEMTATAVMMGSPLYMAPEQMASARDVDARADIWSLGIILHSLLTGAPPFRAPTVMGVYEAIVAGAPPVRKQRPDVPEGLEAAILKCLQKDRRQRFEDVAELAAAIAPFGAQEAQNEASRIKRIMVARSALPGSTPPPPPAAEPVAAATPADASSSSSSSKSEAASVAAKPESPSQGDEHTRPPAARSRRGALMASAVALLCGVPIAYFAMRSQTSARVPSALPVAPSIASTISSALPSVLPGDTARPTVESPPTSASAVQSAAPKASAAVPPPKRIEPAQKPPPRPRGENLFDTQK